MLGPLTDYISMVGLTDVDLDGDWGRRADDPAPVRRFRRCRVTEDEHLGSCFPQGSVRDVSYGSPPADRDCTPHGARLHGAMKLNGDEHASTCLRAMRVRNSNWNLRSADSRMRCRHRASAAARSAVERRRGPCRRRDAGTAVRSSLVDALGQCCLLRARPGTVDTRCHGHRAVERGPQICKPGDDASEVLQKFKDVLLAAGSETL